ncbi:methyltransferase domain-containing protein [Aquicoccus sp. SCR17]|nr:methyltransferase domain-containing protein [Carideicomes alvinocaridis]
MADKKPDLSSAYALRGPEDNNRLYADWAETYDATFAEDMGYLMPGHVAELYKEHGGAGPVLDIGAGTGLVAERLEALGVTPVDATDLSQEMLDVAAAKGVYRDLFAGDVTDRLPRDDDSFAGAVSAGTFTTGHVGPEGLAEVIRLVRPGGLCVLAVNERHWQAEDFAAAFEALGDRIEGLTLPERPYYAHGKGEHAADMGKLAVFRVV